MSRKKRKRSPETIKRARVLGLRKWNRVVHILVKNYKRSKTPYEIANVRREASAIYPNLKSVAYSRITQRMVLQAPRIIRPQPPRDTILIDATQVPKFWFDTPKEWWYIGEWVNDFKNTYPEIKIVIKSPENEIALGKGELGEYTGGVLAEFVELLREEYGDDYDKLFQGITAWFDQKKKSYAFWGEEDTEFPEQAPDFQEITPEERKEIEEREEKTETEKKKRQKKKKKPLEKVVKPKKPKKEVKEEPKEKPPASRVSEIRGLIAELRQDVKDGFITKKQYQSMTEKLIDKMEKGGEI